MAQQQVAPYGEWKSPITSDLIASSVIGLSQVHTDGDDIYWIESRPTEGGRYVIVRRTPDGDRSDVIPPPFNARTLVHEYGGGTYLVVYGVCYFSNYADQRLYAAVPGREISPVTPARDYRYADAVYDAPRRRLIAVREDHTTPGQGAVNTIVAISADGDAAGGQVLVQGNDFYSNPRVSSTGTRMAWLTWDHPNMPWDGCELWVGELGGDGGVRSSMRVAGGPSESIFQPEWSPDGTLYFVSDRTDWWNLYRWVDGNVAPVCPMPAEFGDAQWVFGMHTYAFASADQIVCTYTQNGVWHLALLDTVNGKLTRIETPYQDVGGPCVGARRVVFIGSSPAQPASIVALDVTSGNSEVLRRSTDVQLDVGYITSPQPIEYPTESGLTAHGFYYPPGNKDFTAPARERPPLLVKTHGGPTGATTAGFDPEIQYWTSRGFAVLDVNYGGSTGYGRAYRQRLNGRWGVVDVDDAVNGALYLARQGWVDGERLAIDGGSAGGYTTLAALAFRNVFKAGASYYGLSDLEAFARDTHKFESHYLESLVGPYPQQRDLYYQRSPLHSADRIACPLILFQGLEDKIVPPNQAVPIYEAVRAKGLPVAYFPFEGEQHGFRHAEHIKRSLDAEFLFFARVFGFAPADSIEPFPVDNADGLKQKPSNE